MPNDATCRPGHKIVLCHLESLVCLPALNDLFAHFGSEIVLVIGSSRFGSSHGGAMRQLVSGVRRMGWRQTLYLGFDIVGAQAASLVSRWLRRGARPQSLACVRQLAARHGARFVEVGDVNSAATRELVGDHAPDLVMVMNFDQILQAEFIALPRLGVLNVHPSRLPSLRGPCPAFWALAQERTTAGASVHRIENCEIDAGRLLAQSEIAIDRTLSVAELTTRLFKLGVRLLPTAVAALAADRDAGQPQVLSAGEYRGFPRVSEIALARRRGVRLARAAHFLRLFAASWGIVRWFP
jgi:folate-dependent phosphoribosylglycinamide formyltransferase PurN